MNPSLETAPPATKTRPSAGYGLEGVVVAETELSDVDGELGRLVVRGHAVESLAGRVSFEALCALLWNGALPNGAEERKLSAALARERRAAYERLPCLEGVLELADPMDALRAGIAALPARSSEADSALALTASTAVIGAAWWRRRQGLPPKEPDPTSSHAADLLRSLSGTADPARADALDTYLVTVADHGLNASTFAARVVASTGSDTVSAVTAAIGALKGKLHGGAPGPVLDMLDAIGEEKNARGYLEALLARGERIMGMGHRVYRTRDPRAEVLEAATLRLPQAAPSSRVLLARCVEREATALLQARKPGRGLCANVEFFTAVLLEAVGVPRELFTVTFAAGRVAGWCAHVEEQRRAGRIIRPASRYVGPMPGASA